MDSQRSARRYHCARCHRPVVICSDCDRGHVYCFNGCREAAYKERARRNAQRYRSSAKGRRNNAHRQQRYRERNSNKFTPASDDTPKTISPDQTLNETTVSTDESKKVTHRGSTTPGASVVLPATRNTGPALSCDCCQHHCSAYVRFNFLRTRCRYPSTVP